MHTAFSGRFQSDSLHNLHSRVKGIEGEQIAGVAMHDQQIVFCRNFHDSFHIAREAENMNRKDCPGVRRYLLLDLVGIHLERFRIDIHNTDLTFIQLSLSGLFELCRVIVNFIHRVDDVVHVGFRSEHKSAMPNPEG